MTIDFTAQSQPLVWALGALVILFAALVFTCLDPELAEVYLGEVNVFVAALALAVLALAFAAQLGPLPH